MPPHRAPDEAAAAPEEAEGDDDELEAAAAPLALAIDVNDAGDAEAAATEGGPR